jgi:hypothetical protein
MHDIDPGRAEAMKEIERQLRNLTRGDGQGNNGDAAAGGAAAGATPGTGPVEAAAAREPRALPIDWSTEGTPAYANGMQILHRATEFALLFTDMAAFPGRLSPDGRAGNERAAVVASLRIAPDSFFQMLCVMASNWNRYIGAVTDARMRQPRFKLIDAGDLQLEGLPTPKE